MSSAGVFPVCSTNQATNELIPRFMEPNSIPLFDKVIFFGDIGIFPKENLLPN